MAINTFQRAMLAVAAVAILQGCSDKPYVFSLADFFVAKTLPYDSPLQVIYRIDDHRFVTLERYRDCNHGETYYNDTRAGIRRHLGRGAFENYQGRLINADPTGRNLVFPKALPQGTVCGNGERGCTVGLAYSTNGGKSFSGVTYMENSSSPFEKSKGYAIFVTSNQFYVANRSAGGDAYVEEYPLVPGIDLSKPYPPGVHGSTFAASKRPEVFAKLRTPSGQDRITCDVSIKPTNPDAPLQPKGAGVR